MLKLFRVFIFLVCFSLSGCSNNSINNGIIDTSGISLSTLYDTIIFDIAIVGSCSPTQGALEFLENKLIENRIANEVIFKKRDNLTTQYVNWNSSQLLQFEIKNRVLKNKNYKNKTLAVFIAYIPGVYLVGGEHAAGVQYGNTSFAILRDITDKSWEGVVLLHEFGHMLSIARVGNRSCTPINPERPNHCNNENCAMYWQADTHRTQYCEVCISEIRKLIRGEALQKTILLAKSRGS